MSYYLGVDLGTTFTAAASWRDGRAEVKNLGSHSAAIPSVVLLREDETILTGEAAQRRAMTEPSRVAREFKRRLGDTTPIVLGGSPYSAEALMARLLEAVVEEVAQREGGAPAGIAVTHPANWGEYKRDLLRQAVRLADLPDVTLLTEPEAAAIHYADENRVEPGEIVAVYDLGGGTFDAALLRKTGDGFEILGRPEGVERLGGIDFDAAVFAHIARTLGASLEELDEDDPTAIAAVARLRAECVGAKEALSSDTDTVIPVLLPNVQTEVRITRSEFEAMIRPALADSIGAMHRAFASAGVTPEQVKTVLLVGGSSRIPLVAQLVGSELGRPVAVDTHPKYAVPLGAAIAAAHAAGAIPAAATPPLPAPVPPPPAPEPAAPPAPVVAAGAVAGAAAAVPTPPPTPDETLSTQPTVARVRPEPASGGLAQDPGRTPPPTPPTPTPDKPGGGRKGLLIALVAIALIAIAAGAALALSGGNGDDDTVQTADNGDTDIEPDDTQDGGDNIQVADPTQTAVPEPNPTATDIPQPTPTDIPEVIVPPDELCDESLESSVCLLGVDIVGDELFARYVFLGFTPSIGNGVHFHFYGNAITEENAGSQGTGPWLVWDDLELAISINDPDLNLANSDKLCVVLGDANLSHQAILGTGNCLPLP